MTFGQWVKQTRERLGMQQTELARKCKLTQARMSRIESQAASQQRLMMLVVQALGVSLTVIYDPSGQVSYRSTHVDSGGNSEGND